jgi:hypothetical protein
MGVFSCLHHFGTGFFVFQFINAVYQVQLLDE